MSRPLSAIAPDWWDYTTLDAGLIDEAARLSPRDLARLSRPGFTVVLYDTLEEFYLAEALEYVDAWRQSTDDNPVGICGPIGPTEQLPLVARIVNALDLDVRVGTFLGNGRMVRYGNGSRGPRRASPELRARGSRTVFQPHQALAAHARCSSAFSEGRHARLLPVVGRRRAMRRDAGRARETSSTGRSTILSRAKGGTRTRRLRLLTTGS